MVHRLVFDLLSIFNVIRNYVSQFSWFHVLPFKCEIPILTDSMQCNTPQWMIKSLSLCIYDLVWLKIRMRNFNKRWIENSLCSPKFDGIKEFSMIAGPNFRPFVTQTSNCFEAFFHLTRTCCCIQIHHICSILFSALAFTQYSFLDSKTFFLVLHSPNIDVDLCVRFSCAATEQTGCCASANE